MITHGHMATKFSLMKPKVSQAMQHKCVAVCFGHTHVPNEVSSGIRLSFLRQEFLCSDNF